MPYLYGVIKKSFGISYGNKSIKQQEDAVNGQHIKTGNNPKSATD